MSLLKGGKFFSCGLGLFLVFTTSSSACEKPVFERSTVFHERTDLPISLEWKPVSSAQFYEIKYVLRIPEGRTLGQREEMIAKPSYIFSVPEMAQADGLQLVVEVAAHCDGMKSSSTFVQVALKNPASTCSFDKQLPALTKEVLSWPVIKKAQSYLVCFHTKDNQSTCRSTSDTHIKDSLQNTSLFGVTPVCNNVAGTPAYVTGKALSGD